MLILSRPAIYTLELTASCNQGCFGCSNPYAHHNTRPYTSTETWVSWLHKFGPEAVRIRLTGGEPTLHPSFSHLLGMAVSYDALVTIFTNGRWQNPEKFLTGLRQYANPPGLLISLHGAQPSSHEAFTNCPGSFAEVVTNIRCAIDTGICVALSAVLTRFNLAELEEICQLGLSLGVEHVAFNRYVGPPNPSVEPDLSEMRQAIATIEMMVSDGLPVQHSICLPQCFANNHSNNCLAGSVQITIDPWGGVRPCIYSPTVVGSLYQNSLEEIWHGQAMEAWRQSVPVECDTCAAAATCYGGCRAAGEWHKSGLDPLISRPLDDFSPFSEEIEIPAESKPRLALKIRAEAFGYSLSGNGQVIPVALEALDLLEACNGTTSFAELASRFGEEGLNLLGELWQSGMLRCD